MSSPKSGRGRRSLPYKPEDYYYGPTYGHFDEYRGGSFVEAIIGPVGYHALVSKGSAPQANHCRVVEELNAPDAVPSFDWAKGHLLSQSLGGPGQSRNLTALSRAGNVHHTRYESVAKNFIDRAFSWYESNDKDHYYCLHYKVMVPDECWDSEHKLGKFVPRTLQVVMEVLQISRMFDPGPLWLASRVDPEETLAYFVRHSSSAKGRWPQLPSVGRYALDETVDNTGYQKEWKAALQLQQFAADVATKMSRIVPRQQDDEDEEEWRQ